MPRTIGFHLNEHCDPDIAAGVRRHGIDVTTTPDLTLYSSVASGIIATVNQESARATPRPARRPHLPDRGRDQRDRPGLGAAVPRGGCARRRGRAIAGDRPLGDWPSSRRSARSGSSRSSSPTGERAVARLFAFALDALGGRLDILFHVAGISGRKFGDGPLARVFERRLGTRDADQRASACSSPTARPCGSCSSSRSTRPACGGRW